MPELLTDWVDYHACVRPDEVAVASTEPDAHVPQLTWRQLDDRVGRLARVLLDHGVRRGDRVGLVAENDARIFELQFACMRIGAIMVPLNWRLAVPELRGMLADAAPTCFLHDLAWAELAAQLGTGLDLGPVLAWGDETSSYEQALAASSDPVHGGELDPGATAEVEQALADMPGITEFSVLGVPDEQWGETGLIAVIPEPGVTITLEAVREHAGPRLARFKLPSHLLVITELPRSATDKISRSAIREIWQRGRQVTSSTTACSTAR
jgi:acyl-CoA synthetase (AMP-forming)/AMP-acid ligase II